MSFANRVKYEEPVLQTNEKAKDLKHPAMETAKRAPLVPLFYLN